MKEVNGDIWDFYDKGYWIAITTNGAVKRNGECVMGRGVALEAKQRFPELPLKIGGGLIVYANFYGLENKNRIQFFQSYGIITFPVKYNWWEKADLTLIERSCKQLVQDWLMIKYPLYIVRPGCGNGGLDWKDVKPILEKYLDDKYIVVNRS